MDLRKILLSGIEYGFCFFLFMFMETGVHEWLHLWTLTQLGGEGHIRLAWFGAYVAITKMPRQWYAPTLIALSGGIGVFLLYSIIIYWDWYDKDYEEMVACIPAWLKNLAYGLFEGFWLFQMAPIEFLKWAIIIDSVAFIIGAIVSFALWVKYCLLPIKDS